MKRPISIVWIAAILALAGSHAYSHPHFRKSVTASLPGGIEAKISYGTTPANEMRAKDVSVGSFVTPRGPRLTLSGALEAGGVTIPAGEYTIGVIKNGEADWTMALYPGRLRRGQSPDMSQVIKLESLYNGSAGPADHMLLDITPGSGKLAGRTVLTLHFGSMALAGALS